MKIKKTIVTMGSTDENNYTIVGNIKFTEYKEQLRVEMQAGDNDWIKVYDADGKMLVHLPASRIADFFRDEKQVYFDQTAEGEYICPECGQYYNENELWEYNYCKSCGVRIVE